MTRWRAPTPSTRSGDLRVGAPATRDREAVLKSALDSLYQGFDDADSTVDPIRLVRPFDDPADREVVGFFAAALAFGRVAGILRSIERLLDVLGPSPARFVRTFDPQRARASFARLGHRWVRGVDLMALVWVLRSVLREFGSIEAGFVRGLDPDAEDVSAALESFTAWARAVDLDPVADRRQAPPNVRYFFPPPSAGSACKRLNLFVRWMVRSDRVDLGVWTGVRPSQLIVPLDTHVIRVGQCLRLTRYRSPGWRMAVDITAALRHLDPNDPVRYDFAMCHLGMMDACGFRRPQRDSQCPLRGACHPAGPRTPRASRPPSARR